MCGICHRERTLTEAYITGAMVGEMNIMELKPDTSWTNVDFPWGLFPSEIAALKRSLEIRKARNGRT